MGRGGGGGGSRGFSSGGSRGFSSHSSHSSFSSSSRGGSSFSSGRSYSRPNYSRPNYGSFSYGSRRPSGFSSGFASGLFTSMLLNNRRYNYTPGSNTYYRAPRLSFNPISFILRTIKRIFIIWLIITIIIAIATVGSSGGTTSSGGITKSTVERTKLDSSLVEETSEYYTDTLDWINSKSTLESGMKSFYRKTGVQPYLYICDNINGNSSGYYSADEQEDFGNELYEELFNDEGHLLLVFCEYDTSRYVSFCIVGNSAKTVIDSEAQEILLDYVDHYYYSDYDDDKFFSLSFEQAGDKIMRVEKSHGWIVLLVIVVIVGIIVIIKLIEKQHDKKIAKMKAAQDILNTPLNEFGDDNVEDLAGKYEQQ